jgi:hypothetical protein
MISKVSATVNHLKAVRFENNHSNPCMTKKDANKIIEEGSVKININPSTVAFDETLKK